MQCCTPDAHDWNQKDERDSQEQGERVKGYMTVQYNFTYISDKSSE